MKKHLIAAAVVSVFAAPAMAQNVTIYGNVDYGTQRYDNGTDSYVRSTSGALATSRLGFRGTEDLGGGLKANFMLQGELNMSSAEVTANNTSSEAGAFGFNEEAWVGLAGSFGEIRIGRTDITSAEGLDTTVSQMGNLGNSPSIGGFNATASNSNHVNGELGGNMPNVIRYISPSFNGLSVQLGLGQRNARTTTTDVGAKIQSIAARYDIGGLSLHAGQTVQKATSTAGTERAHNVYAASYNAGFASFGAYYSKSDQNYSAVANPIGTDTADVERTMITAKVPLSGGVALHAGLFSAKVENSDDKGDGYTVAVTKALSKRTSTYAAYSQAQSKGGASFSITGLSAPAADQKTSGLTVGVQHSF